MRREFGIVLSERDQDTLAHAGLADDEAMRKSRGLESKPDFTARLLQKKVLSEFLRISTVDNIREKRTESVSFLFSGATKIRRSDS